MHPFHHATATPEKPAAILAETGEVMTYRQLEDGSNQFAQFLRARGLQSEAVIALMLDNCLDYYKLYWGAQRSGMRFVCISSRLTADETDYILTNSGAKLLVVSASLGAIAGALSTQIERYTLGGALPGYPSLDEALAPMPVARIADERAGITMLYSSGTTGRPKGVRGPMPEDHAIDQMDPLTMVAQHLYKFNADSIYLSPAPLYHAAPIGWSTRLHKLGGTVILMKKFDAEGALSAIETYKTTCGQFVPTHFIRMLKLPAETRAQYDVSVMTCAIHAAAPCPIPVKEAMIKWWGPVIEEYYAGSEGNGMSFINSADWLAHKGSVGKAVLGTIHIMADDCETELPFRTEGTIYSEYDRTFEYHDDPEKTASTRNSKGWTTLGDVGWIDEERYLYLTDRKSFMIISGGVNIYPQEIENHLIGHPRVTDVAVIGGPHDEMGEEVIAVIQPVDMAEANDALREDLIAFAREKLSGFKIPRRIDFLAELPRHDTGKLYKRLLRDQYWGKA